MRGNTPQIHAFSPSKIPQSTSLHFQSIYTPTACLTSHPSCTSPTSLRCSYSNQSKICSQPGSSLHICCHLRTPNVHILRVCHPASTLYNSTSPFLRSYASFTLLHLSLILLYSPCKPLHWTVSSTRFHPPPLLVQISPNSTSHLGRYRYLGRAAGPRSIILDSRPSYDGCSRP